MTLYDFYDLAIESFIQVKIWCSEKGEYVFEGDFGDLYDSNIDCENTEVGSFELGLTENHEPFLGLNVEEILYINNN